MRCNWNGQIGSGTSFGDALEDGVCVFFECVHTHIQARYRQLEGLADIRIFDFARCGENGQWDSASFVPFEETIQLAEQYRLPLVGRHLLANTILASPTLVAIVRWVVRKKLQSFASH
eukprot:419023-Amphidinium_carterae.1